ncbi:MAG: hypothetical protein A3H96_12960 [Acidobacteria bacterium RIFCSPLOWO2_02_FULL_67_36]|nr:MAG: hypothetical protein A3H96_12960 [Acidobacteria bacterium RIFCSPLOWO2_02_FULL_67_36]OFW23533.1 MAG: hypothetical protein A3G21_06270 [Acidobacteria bacterium RIFCSPLOWO2_12_FULL_66_21]
MTPLLNAGRKLHARVRSFFDTPLDATALPLELLQAALDQLERQAQPSGRGARVFPYNRVVVHVAQPDGDRAAIEAVFVEFPARLRERLAEVRCDLPADFQARAAYYDEAPAGRGVLWVECGNEGEAHTVADREVPRLRVTVVKGQCEQPEYAFQEGGIAIGRGTEPTDTLGRVRRNHVAFLEVRDGVSETVARAHARLQFDPATRSYQLFNESGSNPTFLLREGRSIRLAPRDPRGVRVQSGDEVQLGRAVLKLGIEDR